VLRPRIVLSALVGMALLGAARGYAKAFATFIRRRRRVRFASFFNGPAGGVYDLSTKRRSRGAYRRFIVPLSR
jgi:hypothetical protein